MHGFRRFVQELHRRSLWQVLAVYLGGSWAVVEVVDWLTENAGLPDWTPGLALVLLLIGLPIVLATAFIQEGLPGRTPDADPSEGSSTRTTSTGADAASQPAASPEASAAAPGLTATPQAPAPPPGQPSEPSSKPEAKPPSRLFTWRNAVLGGVGAFSLLGVAVVGYFLMWLLGVGPVGSLVAQGVLDARDPLVLADFENQSSDPTAGDLITEALRVDLIDSDVVALAPTVQVQQILERMGQATESVLTPSLAREVAQRAGFKAVLEGDVVSAGAGYVLTARLIAAQTGEEHAAFRESASSPDDLIRAIDKLSERIRNKAGESLPAIRAGEPLSNVTTTSLDALRKYVEAVKIFDRGDYRAAIGLLEEATQLDPAFAMAYRKLAVAMNNSGGYTGAQIREASTKAYENRDRLGDIERYLTIAFYHTVVTLDVDAAIQAYQNVLRVDPREPTALNNLATRLQALDRYDEAAPLLDTAVLVAPTAVAHGNRISVRLMTRDTAGALDALERFAQDYPEHPAVLYHRLNVEIHRGNAAVTHELGLEYSAVESRSLTLRAGGVAGGSYLDRAAGKWREAREHLQEAARFAQLHGDQGTALFWSLNEVGWLVDLAQDTAAARRRIREILASGAFDALPAGSRPWVQVTATLGGLGITDQARAFFGRWDEELPEEARGPTFDAQRRLVESIIELAETGDLDAAVSAIIQARSDSRCERCGRYPQAQYEARRGNVEVAIALFELVIEEPTDIRTYPINRVLALEYLGPLYEAAGDDASAVRAYAEFADAWKDADPELQPRVQRALERVRVLTAEGAGGAPNR